MEGCALVLVVIVVVAAIVSLSQGKARERARLAYQEALMRLKRDPTNPDLREETLRLGRDYSNLMRNKRGVALFDEVALSNDINAACAAVFRSPKQPALLPGRPSIESRLTNLAELKAKGLIDESEYSTRRQEILKDV